MLFSKNPMMGICQGHYASPSWHLSNQPFLLTWLSSTSLRWSPVYHLLHTKCCLLLAHLLCYIICLPYHLHLHSRAWPVVLWRALCHGQPVCLWYVEAKILLQSPLMKDSELSLSCIWFFIGLKHSANLASMVSSTFSPLPLVNGYFQPCSPLPEYVC